MAATSSYIYAFEWKRVLDFGRLGVGSARINYRKEYLAAHPSSRSDIPLEVKSFL
jgi:hypothetical protein